MQNKKQKLINISLPKLKNTNNQIEFQIIDMETLFEIKSNHDIEYPHRLEFNLIMIVIEGEGTHSIDFKSYDYKKGTIFFIKKHQVHNFIVNPNLKCYLLQFSDAFLNRLIKNSLFDIFDYMRSPVNIQLEKNSLDDILRNIDILNNQLKTKDDEFKESILQSLLQAFLLQLKRYKKRQTLSFKDKEQVIYQNFLNMVHNFHKYSIKVDDYSKKLEISSRTLTNLLNKYTGKSTKTYLNEFLLLEIKRYLLDESMTLQEIADTLDFDEPTNLVKFFKKYENTTPSEYKRKTK
jgi:AraC family transcriptional regulator, transcriptional activator of pobA